MEEVLIRNVVMQPFAIILLCFALWVLYKRQTATEAANEKRMAELETKLDNLHNERKGERDQLAKLTTNLLNIVKENSTIIEKVGEWFENAAPPPLPRKQTKL